MCVLELGLVPAGDKWWTSPYFPQCSWKGGSTLAGDTSTQTHTSNIPTPTQGYRKHTPPLILIMTTVEHIKKQWYVLL